MQIDLRGRKALVTGGSLGIGRAIAERLGRSGADVVIVARRKDVVDRTVSELAPVVAGRIVGVSCDVTDQAAVDASFAEIERSVGGIDILVNNAGSSNRSPFLDMTRQMLVSDLDLKLHAAVRYAQLAVPHMRKQRWGRILNIVTVTSKAPAAGSLPTTLSRAAGMALIKVLANEFASDNILVNGLCVGVIKSDQWVREHRARFANMPFEDYLAAKARDNNIPLGRLGEAEEVANVACFLSSDAAGYITGTAINIDGGKCPVM